jgi:hypothetical protein
LECAGEVGKEGCDVGEWSLCRSKALDRGLEEQTDAAGFLMEEIPGSRKRVDGGALEGMIYRLTWKDRLRES